MGLREQKARLVRYAIYEATLSLAEEVGYEAATIDQVADRAEVGVSTVYRYFENKDAILLAPIEEGIGALATSFASRPPDEDVPTALAHAISSVLDRSEEDRAAIRRLSAQIDLASGPRARLWDLRNRQRTLLEEAVLARLGADADPLWAAAAARTSTMVVEMAGENDRLDQSQTPYEFFRRTLSMLHGENPPLPAIVEPAPLPGD
ncbi:MAG TPA: helix-turn-helix domain-containing protein [Lacisediminihabitans sp.]|uniref:TetR/AcrR family transcriptional regulator n=1 Tax=Lacisediminihabitans sp. TaxID=2787631 RepID=UPI002ED7EFED